MLEKNILYTFGANEFMRIIISVCKCIKLNNDMIEVLRHEDIFFLSSTRATIQYITRQTDDYCHIIPIRIELNENSIQLL